MNVDNRRRETSWPATWSGLAAIPPDLGPTAVVIGVFDGVHRGHADLVSRAVTQAQRRGVTSVAATFDPHPALVFAPDRAPRLLTSVHRRAQLLGELGIDAVLLMPFTAEFASWSPQRFVTDVLQQRLHAQFVAVGENFTFGHRGAGTTSELARFGVQLGFEVESAPLFVLAGDRVSSSRVRELLAAGEVEQAALLLGRPYRADGIVVRGEQRGRALGYPTANLELAPDAAVPADGIYAGRVLRLSGDPHRPDELLGTGAVSVGTNPTFAGQLRTVEAFILDFNGDLYGDRLGVEFSHRLRGMVKFDSIEDLIIQMELDAGRARALVPPSS